MSGTNNNEKKTKGKQKIEIKYIENEEDRWVTFSKRKAGINKKASELAILTGAQVGIGIFSPSKRGKTYSFGHPSTEAVIKRFLGQEEVKDIVDLLMEDKQTSDINTLNEMLNNVMAKVDEEKEREKKLKQRNDVERSERVNAWWNNPLEQLDRQGLADIEDYFKKILVEIFHKYQQKIRMNSGASSSSSGSGSANVAPLRVPAEQVPRFPTPRGYE